MWPFKKKRVIHQTLGKWPTRSNALYWMRLQIAQYREDSPDEAWKVFSPYFGDYLPIFLATGFAFDEQAQQQYSWVQHENPDLVQLAKENKPEGMYSVSRVGLNEDF